MNSIDHSSLYIIPNLINNKTQTPNDHQTSCMHGYSSKLKAYIINPSSSPASTYYYVRTYTCTIMKHIAWPKIIHHPLWGLSPGKSGRNFMTTMGLLEPGENSVDESLLAREVLSDGRRVQSAVVPKGCLAVYVGPELRRFVIPMRCLSAPDFRVLMDRVAEEYGFEQEGALKIPCGEEDFQHILVRSLGNNKKDIKKQRSKV